MDHGNDDVPAKDAKKKRSRERPLKVRVIRSDEPVDLEAWAQVVADIILKRHFAEEDQARTARMERQLDKLKDMERQVDGLKRRVAELPKEREQAAAFQAEINDLKSQLAEARNFILRSANRFDRLANALRPTSDG